MTILSHIRWCQLPMKPERKGLTRRDRIITWSQSTAVWLISLFKVAFKQYVISSRILTTLKRQLPTGFVWYHAFQQSPILPLWFAQYSNFSTLKSNAFIEKEIVKKNYVQIILNDSVFSFRCSCTKPVNNFVR